MNGESGEYTQVFLYRVPVANHDRFLEVEGQLGDLFLRCGMLSSNLYVLEEGRVFSGFRDLRGVMEAKADEEVWLEIDAYRDAEDSARVIAEIGKDPQAGRLFGEVLQIAAQGVLWPQGNAGRVHPRT